MNKLVEPDEIQKLNLPMYITDFKAKPLLESGKFPGKPKQAVAYQLVRIHHSTEKNWSGKNKPKNHFVTWMVPNTFKWMLIFVTSAASYLADLGQYLRLGALLLSPTQLRTIEANVRAKFKGMTDEERNLVIKDLKETPDKYL
jgi:hypothetical protein